MEIEVGKVTHYFNKIGVAVIELKDKLKVGDKIHIKGATTDFTQVIESMQINHSPVQEAGYGQSIGLKVEDRVREGDIVYKIEETEEAESVREMEMYEKEEERKTKAKVAKPKAMKQAETKKGKRGRPKKSK